MGEIRGRVAVVSGGSRGIGAATAVALAEAGWRVCVGYRVDATAARAVVEQCEAAGGEARCVEADVSTSEGVAALFTVADEMGVLGALVNNAGIGPPPARVDAMSRDRVHATFAVNAVAPIVCAGEAVRRMSTRAGGEGGVIVNVSSAAARLGSPGEYVDYAASKGALDTMTLGLAREVASEGIRVNAVRPGLIETDFHASTGRPDRVERLRGTIPMERAGLAAEVAAAIVSLCSPDASYVTGALLDVSGGR